MAQLKWDEVGKRGYETGVDHGVLYVADNSGAAGTTWGHGVAWNGLTTVTQSPDGAEPTAIYADNIKYLNILSIENFGATIEAYTYPDAFAACDGSAELGSEGSGVSIDQQERKKFCFCYRTKVGTDLNPEAGYKLHIIYNCLAQPSERSYETVNDSPSAITFSWEVSTTPVDVTGMKPTAHLVIDSTKCNAAKLKLIEDKLYGTATEEPTVVMPDEIVTILKTK